MITKLTTISKTPLPIFVIIVVLVIIVIGPSVVDRLSRMPYHALRRARCAKHLPIAYC
jgi:hypothetical protein